MMTGRTFRAMIGTLIIFADIFLVYKQIGSGEHFVINDLVFHALAFGGGLLLIDFKVGSEVIKSVSGSKVMKNVKKRVSGRFGR